MRRAEVGGRILGSAFLIGALALPFVPLAPAGASDTDLLPPAKQHMVRMLVEAQLEELGLPEEFLPFLRSDAEVATGRDLYGDPAPDLNRDGSPSSATWS